MPKSPQLPEKRLNISLLDGYGLKLFQLRNQLEQELGGRLSWADVVRHAINDLHNRKFNNQ